MMAKFYKASSLQYLLNFLGSNYIVHALSAASVSNRTTRAKRSLRLEAPEEVKYRGDYGN